MSRFNFIASDTELSEVDLTNVKHVMLADISGSDFADLGERDVCINVFL